MKMRSLSAVLLLVLALAMVLGGCATTFKAGNGKLSYGDMSGAPRGKFEKKAAAISIISPYLFPLGKPYEHLDNMIDPAIYSMGANAATNVEVKYGFDLIGLIIGSLTGGILNWGYVSVSGTAISR